MFQEARRQEVPVPPLPLSRHSRITAGVLLLSLVAVETGGWYLTQVVTGGVELTTFQQDFARAGHAHAGMLVTLGLIGLLLADAAGLTGVRGVLGRHCVPIGALLMSAGFFLSSGGQGTTEPNGLIALVWIGAISLAVGLITLGGSLLAGSGAQPTPPAAPTTVEPFTTSRR
jgi:hypothetical protein